MKPGVSLCKHLRAPELAALPIDPDDVLDWQDGPVTAFAICAECGEPALLERVEGERGGRVWVYAVAGIERESLGVYRRDVMRGSCDPSRLERETEALLSSAGPVERLLTVDLETHAVLGSAAPPAGLS